MGGGSGSSSSQTQSGGGLPGWAQRPYRQSEKQWATAQGGLPSISQLYSGIPMLDVPNLNAGQLSAISGFENMPQGPNAQEQAALSSLGQFTPTTPGGITPLTAATEAQFNTATLPTLQNAAANMGQGNSGAMLEAIQNGQVNALVPELTAQNQQQLQAAQATGALGSQVYSQDVTNLTNSLQAAGLPYEVAQQQAQAYFNQQQQKQQFGQEVQLGPFSQIPAIFGNSTSVTTSNPGGGSKF